MSASPQKVAVLSRVLRERDALVTMCERLAMFAAHAEGCRGDEFMVHQCGCGCSSALDDSAKLCEGIREGWK